MIDKAINVRNRKYNRIIYVNAGLSISNINNTIKFLNTAYGTISFVPKLVDCDLEIGEIAGVETVAKVR